MSSKNKKDPQAALVEIESLIKVALSRDSLERERALDAVVEAMEPTKRSGSRRLIARLVARAHLSDPRSIVRNNAVEHLEEIGTGDDIYGIEQLLQDRHWMVRASACSALARLAGERAMKLLVTRLKDRNAIVRRYAAVALTDVMGTTAEGKLREALKVERENAARIGMLFGLARCGDLDAVRELLSLAHNESKRISSPASACLFELKLGEEGATAS